MIVWRGIPCRVVQHAAHIYIKFRTVEINRKV